MPNAIGATCAPRIAGGFRPFRPRVTIAVQRYAFDAQADTALVKLRGTVACANRAQIRKQRAASRQILENSRHVVVKAHDGDAAGFFARETDDVVLPVHIDRKSTRLNSSHLGISYA